MSSDEPPMDDLPAEVSKLQEAVRLSPSSRTLRAKLLQAYVSDAALRGHPDRIEQVLWHVCNRPRDSLTRSPFAHLYPSDSAEGFARVEQAWASQHASAPDDAQIACGYACFVAGRDAAEALLILQRFVERDPKHPEVWMDMGRIAENPAERLRLFLQAQERGASGATLREFIAASAIDANNMDAAQAIGRELLEHAERVRAIYGEALDWKEEEGALWSRALEHCHGDRSCASELISARSDHANDKHWGHTNLGVVALRANDQLCALTHLRASGEVVGNPRLRSYGPSFELARELCAVGFRSEVDAYLVACRAFWQDECIEAWREELANGKVPEF